MTGRDGQNNDVIWLDNIKVTLIEHITPNNLTFTNWVVEYSVDNASRASGTQQGSQSLKFDFYNDGGGKIEDDAIVTDVVRGHCTYKGAEPVRREGQIKKNLFDVVTRIVPDITRVSGRQGVC
jgi:hypothetical protein